MVTGANSLPIFLDGHASSPLAPEARRAIHDAWHQAGNPHSNNVAGAILSQRLELSRESVAQLVGADTSEVYFTSGATESNNLAILGAAMAHLDTSRRQIVVSAIEHKSVLAPAEFLERFGFDICVVPVRPDGSVDPDTLRRVLSDRTLLVSIMAANNETGVLQNIQRVSQLAQRVGALVHCDAAQAVGRIPLTVDAISVDYLSISSHKMYGPAGVGALFVAAASPRLQPLMFGGDQERGVRPGTVPVALAAGMGAAADVSRRELERDIAHSLRLRESFLDSLRRDSMAFRVVGEFADRLPGSLGLLLDGIDGDSLVDTLSREVTLSTGSACTSGMVGPSHVLTAIGISPTEAKSFVRLYFGRYNSLEEVDHAARAVRAAITT